MNGRIYDPVLGRFLSADTQIPYPDDLQSYNRYSYCRNNPLRRIDPSGYGDEDLATQDVVLPASGEVTVNQAAIDAIPLEDVDLKNVPTAIIEIEDGGTNSFTMNDGTIVTSHLVIGTANVNGIDSTDVAIHQDIEESTVFVNGELRHRPSGPDNGDGTGDFFNGSRDSNWAEDRSGSAIIPIDGNNAVMEPFSNENGSQTTFTFFDSPGVGVSNESPRPLEINSEYTTSIRQNSTGNTISSVNWCVSITINEDGSVETYFTVNDNER